VCSYTVSASQEACSKKGAGHKVCAAPFFGITEAHDFEKGCRKDPFLDTLESSRYIFQHQNGLISHALPLFGYIAKHRGFS